MDYRDPYVPLCQVITFKQSDSGSLERTQELMRKAEQRDTYPVKIFLDGPDVIRTHDLPVISRAHHRAMLRAQKVT